MRPRLSLTLTACCLPANIACFSLSRMLVSLFPLLSLLLFQDARFLLFSSSLQLLLFVDAFSYFVKASRMNASMSVMMQDEPDDKIEGS
jgi:hypothetical protein